MDSTRGYYLMKTITKHRKRGLLLSLLCARAAAIFLSGCGEAPYVTANDTGYYYPTGNPVRDYWGYYQPYPFSDTPYGPRYRIIDGMHVYEPYPYPGY
jgi:hypothetical protein